MIARKLFYWSNNSRYKGKWHGPRYFVIITPDNAYSVDIAQNWHPEASKVWTNAIGILTLVPADNTWSGEFIGPERTEYLKGNFNNQADAADALRTEHAKSHKDYNELINNPTKYLERELSCHDWYYHYSDDHRSWSSGEAHWRKIRELLNQVPTETVKELWDKYAPKDFNCPV